MQIARLVLEILLFLQGKTWYSRFQGLKQSKVTDKGILYLLLLYAVNVSVKGIYKWRVNEKENFFSMNHKTKQNIEEFVLQQSNVYAMHSI